MKFEEEEELEKGQLYSIANCMNLKLLYLYSKRSYQIQLKITSSLQNNKCHLLKNTIFFKLLP